jgi:hypothetical protein
MTFSSLLDPAKLAKALAGGLFDAAKYISQQLGLLKRTVIYTKAAADSLAGDLTAADRFASTPIACKALRVRIIPKGALTQSTTLYATLILGWDNGAGGAIQPIATITTKPTANGGTGSWVANTAIIWTTALTNTDIPADAVYSLSIGKASTGTIVPIALVELITTGS